MKLSFGMSHFLQATPCTASRLSTLKKTLVIYTACSNLMIKRSSSVVVLTGARMNLKTESILPAVNASKSKKENTMNQAATKLTP
jgi:hypothetical protein